MKFDFCAACGSRERLQHHHIIPRSEGGGDDPINLVTLCANCHHKIHSRRVNGAYNHGKLVIAGTKRVRAGGKPSQKLVRLPTPISEELRAKVERELSWGVGIQKVAKLIGLLPGTVSQIKRELEEKWEKMGVERFRGIWGEVHPNLVHQNQLQHIEARTPIGPIGLTEPTRPIGMTGAFGLTGPTGPTGTSFISTNRPQSM